ncbi:MAG: GTPase Era, partial [Dehalococcoidia bacterium]
MPAKVQKPKDFRSGYVAILGRPNVGKSTLLNRLLRFRLCGVSPRPQTTRHKLLGVLTGQDYQAVFLDTPGFLRRAQKPLDRRMVHQAREAMQEADLVVLMVEPRMPGDIEQRLIKELGERQQPTILAINKVDLVKKPWVLPVMEAYSGLYPFLELVPISALHQGGVDLLLELVVQHLPPGEPLFPADTLTDRPERFLTGELVREQVFQLYGQEVPYSVAVDVEEFVEGSAEHGGKDYISATIYVEKPGQKAILIGSGGTALKQVGVRARRGIEALLGRPVHLELWVKVHPGWPRDEAFLQEV